MRNVATITVGMLGIFGAALPPPQSTVAASPPSTDDPISLSGVEEISIAGVGRATVAIGSPSELRVSGPPNVVAQLDVTVDDGELAIEPGPQAAIELGSGEELLYEIVVERLADIRLRDQVSLELVGISGDDMGIELRDTTAATVGDVALEELDVDVQGNALLRITGATGELNIDARQSGAFDGTELTASTADVEARDSARVVVNVSSLLEAEASDNAVIEHVGTPAQGEAEVSDAGVVRPATGSLLPAAPATGPASATSPATSPDTGPAPGLDTSQTAEPATFEVSTAGRAFNPAVLEIAVGDTVTWINDDDTEHTATAFDGAFDSGELAEGASFSFTFETPGEFEYRCLFHSEMQGTIIVR
jgi:plastocyanin